MNFVVRPVKDWLLELWNGWNRFWFAPEAPHTLAFIRIGAGAMLFYTHLIWSLDLIAFLGPQSWVQQELVRELHRDSYAWSYLWYIDSPALLWLLHGLGLAVLAAFTVGFYTRVTSVLAALITLSYCHRLTGSLFGLDQINAMLALYLAVGPSGAVYSVDHWLAQRRTPRPIEPPRALSTRIAIRLIQLHMCVIYLFGGIGKMRGELWWDGSASWFAIANLEYQSWDMTWLVHYPFLLAFATHVTVLWETFYCFLVWPRLTRPIAIGIAVIVHGGIALFLGMPTFGLVMLIGNAAFLPPELIAGVIRFRRSSPAAMIRPRRRSPALSR